MRTTVNIDDDVLDRARSVAEKLDAPFRYVVNEALRAGLESFEESAESKPYETKPHRLGLRQGKNLDNIAELLAQVEGEEHR